MTYVERDAHFYGPIFIHSSGTRGSIIADNCDIRSLYGSPRSKESGDLLAKRFEEIFSSLDDLPESD